MIHVGHQVKGGGYVYWENSTPSVTQGSRLMEALPSVAVTSRTCDFFGLQGRERLVDSSALQCGGVTGVTSAHTLLA